MDFIVYILLSAFIVAGICGLLNHHLAALSKHIHEHDIAHRTALRQHKKECNKLFTRIHGRINGVLHRSKRIERKYIKLNINNPDDILTAQPPEPINNVDL